MILLRTAKVHGPEDSTLAEHCCAVYRILCGRTQMSVPDQTVLAVMGVLEAHPDCVPFVEQAIGAVATWCDLFLSLPFPFLFHCVASLFLLAISVPDRTCFFFCRVLTPANRNTLVEVGAVAVVSAVLQVCVSRGGATAAAAIQPPAHEPRLMLQVHGADLLIAVGCCKTLGYIASSSDSHCAIITETAGSIEGVTATLGLHVADANLANFVNGP